VNGQIFMSYLIRYRFWITASLISDLVLPKVLGRKSPLK
jgi:hypothetical protein